jgi:Tol biopolymer transport system component
MYRKEKWMSLKALVIFLFAVGLSLACASSNQNVKGKSYSMKTVYVYEIIETKAAKEEARSSGKSVSKVKGIASESIIEESPNVKGVTRVTDFKGSRDISYPTVSADGAYIVFSLYDQKTKGVNLWKKNVMGSGLTRLTKGPYVDTYPCVSRDGKYVYFSSNRAGTFNIWRIKISGGGGITRITTHRNRDFSPCISHDGTRLVFHSYSEGDTQPQIWTCETDGTNLTQLRIGYRPRWSKNDNKILFLAPSDEQDSGYGTSAANNNYDVWEMDIDGTSTTQLTTSFKVYNADYAPDGKILFSALNENTKKPNKDIWIGNTQMTTNPSDDDFPFFDDQDHLFFRSNRGFSWDYWKTTPIESD